MTTSHLPTVLRNKLILLNSFFGKASPPSNLRRGYQEVLPRQHSELDNVTYTGRCDTDNQPSAGLSEWQGSCNECICY